MYHKVPFGVIALMLAVAVPVAFAFRTDVDPAATPAAVTIQSAPRVIAPLPAQRRAAQDIPGVEVRWDDRTGTPVLLRAVNLAAQNSGGRGLTLSGAGALPADAIAVLDRVAAIYRITDAQNEFSVARVEGDALGFQHARVQQVYRDLPVVGGSLIVHFNSHGAAYQVNGRYIPDLALDLQPALAATTAVYLAQQDLAARHWPAGRLSHPPRLVVFALDLPPRLAYELTIAGGNQQTGPGYWRYWIDALTGRVLTAFNAIPKAEAPASLKIWQLLWWPLYERQSGPALRAGTTPSESKRYFQGFHVSQSASGLDAMTDAVITGSVLAGEGGERKNVTGWHDTPRYLLSHTLWSLYNADIYHRYPDSGQWAFRTTADWGMSDPVEMSAAVNFNTVQSYYRAAFGRNSYDNAGAVATVNVHVGGGDNNAYWDPSQQAFFFYDSDEITWSGLTVLDVCGHEFTHAVTENTAGLIYLAEPGALNESFSDLFGAVIEFYSQPDGRLVYPARTPGAADWLMGEDATYPSATALRDMRNPPRYWQPSRYQGANWRDTSDISEENDYGGVHVNSGVQNFFFYLLCEGGNGDNDGIGYNVTGIGLTNATAIAYRALTVYLTFIADYAAARDAWLSAARDLNAAWVSSVEAAWLAVGLSSPVPPPPPVIQHVRNDYTGDRRSDLTLYLRSGGCWCIDSLVSGNVANGFPWGGSGYLPVEGDFNGGGQADPAVYAPALGILEIYETENGQSHIYSAVGTPESLPVSGDYDGDGATDFALYNRITGDWTIWSLARNQLILSMNFSAPGAQPVEGDFNGGGQADLALYAEATGYWMIYLTETGLRWDGYFGGPGDKPASGDYNGDGATEVTLYNESRGTWKIYAMSGGVLAYNWPMGVPGCTAVPGDYDGDGITDLTLYAGDSGYWYSYFSGSWQVQQGPYGGPGLIPVVNWMWY